MLIDALMRNKKNRSVLKGFANLVVVTRSNGNDTGYTSESRGRIKSTHSTNSK